MNSRQPDSGNQQVQQEITLRQILINITGLFNYLLAKWKTLLLIGLLGAIIGFAYAWSRKPFYTAKLSFVMEETNSGGLGNLSGLASLTGINLGAGGGGLFQGENIMELYKSRTMLSKALMSSSPGNDTLLVERFIRMNDLRKEWEGTPFESVRFNLPYDELTVTHQAVLGKITRDINESHLQVRKNAKLASLIEVETKAPDELFAKDFTEQLVNTVNNFYIDTRTKKSLENLAILQHQTDSIRRELNAAIGGMAVALDANPNANPARQALRVPSSRRQVDVQTNQAILSELVKNLELAKITLRKEVPLIQVVDNPILPLGKSTTSTVRFSVLGFIIFIILGSGILVLRKLYKSIIGE